MQKLILGYYNPSGGEIIVGDHNLNDFDITCCRLRLLIARAVYKNPDFLFFDEATNALDTENEKVITDNLNHFYKDKTTVIVAHRLSTVRNADQIVVLDKGRVVEIGNHAQLTQKKAIITTLSIISWKWGSEQICMESPNV